MNGDGPHTAAVPKRDGGGESGRARRWPGWGAPLLAALVLTLCNAAKPLVVDDTAFLAYARQILAHPADPYGFEILWFDLPERALGVLAPPVLPYWLAGAMALLGAEPVAWKLSLLPFALVLAFALRALLTRVAPEAATPLLWLAMLSPAVLPFLNLMLDVPSLALALGAVALFFSACDGAGAARALAAGLVAGLAAQTKYPAATSVAAILVAGEIFARRRLALLAAAAAAGLFLGWEALMALRYGEPHLVASLGHAWIARRGPWWARALVWTAGLLGLLGAIALPAGLVGLVGLRMGPWRVGLFALAAALALAAIARLPIHPLEPPQVWPGFDHPPAEQSLLLALGLATTLVVIAVAVRSLRAPAREDVFLALWLAIEVAAFYALSPFLAARRVLGISLVALLVCGRAASRAIGPGESRLALHLAVAAGALVGLFFYANELADASASPDAVQRTEQRLAQLGAGTGGGTVWFVGHWGFEFYAERAGWRAIVPGRPLLRAGDWVVVPHGVAQQAVDLSALGPVLATVTAGSRLPWSTIPAAYAGPTPLERRAAVRIQVRIHRVAADGVARPLAPPGAR